jgi:hypothetical protein
MKSFFVLGSLALACGLAHAQAIPPGSALRADGLGKLKIGMSLASANRVLAQKIKPTPPSLRANPRCDYQALAEAPGVAVAFVEGRLARIDVSKPGIADERGIRLGDRLEEAAAKLPDSKKESLDHDPEGTSLVSEAAGSRNGLRYQFEEGKLTLMIAGDRKVIRFSEGCD